jgi:hypothetical protein
LGDVVGSEPSTSPRRPEPTTSPKVVATPRPPAATREIHETEEQRRQRRDLLARKLAGKVSPPTTPSPLGQKTMPGPVPQVAGVPGVQQSAAEMLRERFDKLGDDVRKKRLRKYLDAAEEAMARGDIGIAAAAYDQASRLIPEDPELARKAAEVQKLLLGKR